MKRISLIIFALLFIGCGTQDTPLTIAEFEEMEAIRDAKYRQSDEYRCSGGKGWVFADDQSDEAMTKACEKPEIARVDFECYYSERAMANSILSGSHFVNCDYKCCLSANPDLFDLADTTTLAPLPLPKPEEPFCFLCSEPLVIEIPKPSDRFINLTNAFRKNKGKQISVDPTIIEAIRESEGGTYIDIHNKSLFVKESRSEIMKLIDGEVQ